MNYESIRCDVCPIRDTCDAHTFFTQRMTELTAEIMELRLEMEATTK